MASSRSKQAVVSGNSVIHGNMGLFLTSSRMVMGTFMPGKKSNEYEEMSIHVLEPATK